MTLADCDTQQSSSEWIREAVPGVKAVRLDNPDVILNEFTESKPGRGLRRGRRPGQPDRGQVAHYCCRADLAIVPCKASMLEVRALAKATEVLRQAQDIRKGVPTAVIVLSMIGMHYPPDQGYEGTPPRRSSLPLASNAMILRQIYADAPGQGAVVWNMGARARDAANEVDALFHEILPDVAKSESRQNDFPAKIIAGGSDERTTHTDRRPEIDTATDRRRQREGVCLRRESKPPQTMTPLRRRSTGCPLARECGRTLQRHSNVPRWNGS